MRKEEHELSGAASLAAEASPSAAASGDGGSGKRALGEERLAGARSKAARSSPRWVRPPEAASAAAGEFDEDDDEGREDEAEELWPGGTSPGGRLADQRYAARARGGHGIGEVTSSEGRSEWAKAKAKATPPDLLLGEAADEDDEEETADDIEEPRSRSRAERTPNREDPDRDEVLVPAVVQDFLQDHMPEKPGEAQESMPGGNSEMKPPEEEYDESGEADGDSGREAKKDRHRRRHDSRSSGKEDGGGGGHATARHAKSQESMPGGQKYEDVVGGLGHPSDGEGIVVSNSNGDGYVWLPEENRFVDNGKAGGSWHNSGQDDEVPVPQRIDSNKDTSWQVRLAEDETFERRLEELGAGVGAMTFDKAPSEDRGLNYAFRRRLEVQDYATLFMLVLGLLLTVVVSLMLVYHMSDDPSPALYYSDPKYTHTLLQRVVCEEQGADAFLRAFNTQPQVARLRLVGKSGDHPDIACHLRNGRIMSALEHMCEYLCDSLCFRDSTEASSWDTVAFDVSLDITPFITGDGSLASDGDMIVLEKHLNAQDSLEVIMLHKEVEWTDWEDIATNVKHRLRCLGFPGQVEVSLEAVEEILVYRNDQWQNFVRNRVTQALVTMSIVGPFFWLPYLYKNQKTVRVTSKFKVNLDLNRYWEHLSQGLNGRHGFQGSPSQLFYVGGR